VGLESDLGACRVACLDSLPWVSWFSPSRSMELCRLLSKLGLETVRGFAAFASYRWPQPSDLRVPRWDIHVGEHKESYALLELSAVRGRLRGPRLA
jgi:hypothetical protein